nr:unnamed protein product [Trichobilharzia regenti]
MSRISKNFVKTFFRYVSRGECQKVEKLLSKGFDPNLHCPKTGETPLTIAVTRSKPYEMISTLISGGAHRDFYSLAGYTPLHKAVTVGNFEGVKTLLDFGQSPNCLDRSGLTPLYYNILYDPDTRICHSLLYEHSRIGVVDKDGLQEIHQATRLNRVEQINLLLMYGADVNARCKRPKETVNSFNLCIRPQSVDGDTPLHVAANYNQRAAVLRLLSWGADPTLVNADNMTPIQVAQSNGNTELAELIRLFRGRKESSDIFLPTPTYNPHRRIRQPPPNSYITEPSIPQNYSPNNNNNNNNKNINYNTINENRSIDNNQINNQLLKETNNNNYTTDLHLNITEKSATCTCAYVTSSSNRILDSRPVQRAVSLGELIQPSPLDVITPKWNGAWNLGPSGFNSPCIDYHHAVSNDIYCDITRNNDGTSYAGTLTRPIQLKPRIKETSVSKAKTDSRSPSHHHHQQQDQHHHYHQQQQRQQCPAFSSSISNKSVRERTISRGQQTDMLYDFITSAAKGFQREGSQTDSGISNSSCRPSNFGSLNRRRTDYSIDKNDSNGSNTQDANKSKYQEDVLSSYENFSQKNINRNSDRPFSQQARDSSNDKCFPIQKIKGQSHNGGKMAHINVRDSRHLPRSSTMHEYLDLKCAANSSDAVRTVILERYTYSANGSDKNEQRSSFGLSIRTVKNASVIAEFTPTMSRPSLQTVKRVVTDSPAEKAGVKVGDFVLKINGTDVTRASLNQVVDLLSSSTSDRVSLTLISPKCLSPSTLNINNGNTHEEGAGGTCGGSGGGEHYVISKGGSNGNSIHLINKFTLPAQPVKSIQTVRSTKLVRHSTVSPISSERSSERTNVSSLNRDSCMTDEGIWCQSPNTSTNVSARSSSSSRQGPTGNTTKLLINPSILQQSSMPNSKQNLEIQSHRVRFRGLPRSQTTTGISNVDLDKSGIPLTNSLYFPRHPRFHRVGSNDSQGSSYSCSNSVQSSKPITDDLHVIDGRLHRNLSNDYPSNTMSKISSRQAVSHRSFPVSDQQSSPIITGRPTHLIRRPISLNPETRKKNMTSVSDNESTSTLTPTVMTNEARGTGRGVSPTNSELLLPPPAEFSG